MPGRVAVHLYTREILRLLDELTRAEAMVLSRITSAREHLQECYDAGRFASQGGELPTQHWLDEAHDEVDATGVRLREIARGGRDRKRRGC